MIIKFWSDLTRKPQVNTEDKILIGNNTTRGLNYTNVSDIRDFISEEIDAKAAPEYYPLEQGETTLPVPPTIGGNTMERAWTWLEQGLTYSQSSGPNLAAPLGKQSRADWDGTVWTLKLMGDLPTEVKSPVIEEGVDLAPTTDAVAKYAVEKGTNSQIITAITGDEEYMWMYVDEPGGPTTIVGGVSRESIPWYSVPYESDKIDGVGYEDDNGLVIEIPGESQGGSSSVVTRSVDFSDTLEYRAQIVSKNGVWNQWINPTVKIDKFKDTWQTSVGSDDQLFLSKIWADGRFGRFKLGNIRSNLGSFKSDDHNAPAILLDNREGAEYPLMIFQVDHNTTPMRVWKFSSLDPTTFDMDSWEDIGTTNLAYSQPHRYGDEIFVFARRPALPRPWRILYSSDNGATWVQKDVFYPSADWLYMLTKDSEDGNGVHLMSYGHPQNSQNQNIYYLYLDFATGEIRNPATGVVVSNIRTAMTDSAFVPIDPFTAGLQFYTATGTEINRMWDFKEDANTITLILTAQQALGRSKENFESAVYRVVNFDKNTGSINFTQTLGKAGYSASIAPDEYTYYAGGCLVNTNTAIYCRWTPQSISDGKDDMGDPMGTTTITSCTFDGTTMTEVVQWTSPLKVIRPYVTEDKVKISFAECKYFTSYADFYSNLLTFDINTINF